MYNSCIFVLDEPFKVTVVNLTYPTFKMVGYIH